MRDWVLHNTNISIEEYDYVIDTYQILEEFLRYQTNYSDEYIKAVLEKFNESKNISKNPKDKIIKAIEYFTLNYNNSNVLLSIKTGISKCKDHYVLKGYEFNPLSTIYTKYEKELTSLNRYHKCHEAALRELFDLDIDYYVLAKINDRNGSRCLHSFVIKDDYVYDYTLNLIMQQDMYFDLMDVTIINKMTKDELLYKFEELKKYKNNDLQINLPEFYAWPDEILMTLKMKRD